MKQDIGHLQEDIRARDEQIQKRSDQMLANIQTIKSIDEKLAALKAKMASLELEEQTDADVLRRAAEIEASPHSRIVAEMGQILASVDRLAEEVDQNEVFAARSVLRPPPPHTLPVRSLTPAGCGAGATDAAHSSRVSPSSRPWTP